MKKWKKTHRQRLKKNGKKKTNISLTFPEETIRELKQLAHEASMSIGNYITYLMDKIDQSLLDELYEKHKKKDKEENKQ